MWQQWYVTLLEWYGEHFVPLDPLTLHLFITQQPPYLFM